MLEPVSRDEFVESSRLLWCSGKDRRSPDRTAAPEWPRDVGRSRMWARLVVGAVSSAAMLLGAMLLGMFSSRGAMHFRPLSSHWQRSLISTSASECEDVFLGDPCFRAVAWAMTHGIDEHPDWYYGLESGAAFADFQIVLHIKKQASCKLPCGVDVGKVTKRLKFRPDQQEEAAGPEAPVLPAATPATSPLPPMTAPSTTPSTLPPTPLPVAPPAAPVAPPAAPACTPKRAVESPSLFCFEVMHPDGVELELVQSQWTERASIFACNDFAVISQRAITLGVDECGNEIGTWVNDVADVPMGDAGAATSSFLNTQAFMVAWDTLIGSGKLWDHAFIVKADPDCVFFPSRLRSHVVPQENANSYFLNCNIEGEAKLFGALEVFSMVSIRLYSEKIDTCKSLDWNKWGEDLYMQVCLKVLGSAGIPDFDLVGDDRCSPAACSDTDKVAYHPYKDVQRYWECHRESKEAVESKGLPQLGI